MPLNYSDVHRPGGAGMATLLALQRLAVRCPIIHSHHSAIDGGSAPVPHRRTRRARKPKCYSSRGLVNWFSISKSERSSNNIERVIVCSVPQSAAPPVCRYRIGAPQSTGRLTWRYGFRHHLGTQDASMVCYIIRSVQHPMPAFPTSAPCGSFPCIY